MANNRNLASKRKIIFCTMGLLQGGTEWTLIKALDVINYDENDVTLYLRKKQESLIPMVNKNVKIVINDDYHDYEKSLLCYVLKCIQWIMKMFDIKNGKTNFLKRKMRQYVLYRRQKYEKTFFLDKKWDLAIAYDMQKECLLFTSNNITAKRKIAFFHGSIIDTDKVPIYAKYDKIVTVNPKVCIKAKSMYPDIEDKICFIENYTKVDEIIKMSKKATGIKPTKELVLCTCGRIAPEKGFELAVYAAKILKDNNIDFYWYFVGDGICKSEIQNIIRKLDLQNSIEITGFSENPYTYMKLCDIYIQPSWHESFGITILEAIVLQKPIISTKTFGGVYLSEKYGCVNICDFSAETLANEIQELFQNKGRRDTLVDCTRKVNWILEEKRYAEEINQLIQF